MVRFFYSGFIILTLTLLSSCGSNGSETRFNAVTHFKRGNTYYHQHNVIAAIDEYKRAISLRPDQERFHYNLGLAYYSAVLYRQAIESYLNAINLNPEFAEAWYNLSLAFEKNDETEKAVLAYEKYQSLSQHDTSKHPGGD